MFYLLSFIVYDNILVPHKMKRTLLFNYHKNFATNHVYMGKNSSKLNYIEIDFLYLNASLLVII